MRLTFQPACLAGRMFVQPGRFVYNFIDEGRLEELHLDSHSPSDGEATSRKKEKINGHTVVVQFIGANSAATPMTFGKSVEYYNYFLGNDSCKWASQSPCLRWLYLQILLQWD